MDSHFLFYLGSSNVVQEALRKKAVSSAQPKLNKTDVKTVHIPIPPIEEQKVISAFLDTVCLKIDLLIKDLKTQDRKSVV